MPWEELVSAALVGTDRRPYTGDLLADAAVEVVRQRAGRRPGPPAQGPAAAEESQEKVGLAAADRLAAILAGEHPRLLPEWLELAAAGGRRVPPHRLPELLDKGQRDRSIREHLGVLAGQRGRWLAERNPAWAYLLEEPTGEAWELGGRADRRAHLKELRAADPDEARRLLESTWEQETPDDRAAFLELFDTRLSLADEPFLEAALDDRRREVRQQAANLLAKLPGSALAVRMAERVRQCVTVGRSEIVVIPPLECDRAMERDGVRAKPPAGTGERAWWMQQLIARAPLSIWTHPPEELVAKRISDWETEVRLGWVRAAILQRDPAWARAMFAWDPIADLLVALPPLEQQALAAAFAERHDLDNQLIMVLGGVAPPWQAGLAVAVLNKIVKTATLQPWNLGELSRIAAERIDPALHELAAGVPEVAGVLRFRAKMREELS